MSTLITFTGAGATGKTSLVNRLVELAPQRTVIHRSIVREFYAAMQVPNEAAFLALSPANRRGFQLQLYDHYLNALEHFVREVPQGKDIILCERSVFDHFAYTLYGTRELLQGEDFHRLWHGIRRFMALKPAVLYLPYPTPWDNAATASDGFRAREVAKDTLVDAMICKLLSQCRTCWRGTLNFESVDSRASQVIQTVWGERENDSPVCSDH